MCIFHVSVGLLYIFFGKVSIRSFPHFLTVLFNFLLLSCLSSFYFLDINLLPDTWFTNIFSHSIGCLFTLLVVSFVVQSLFSLMQSCLFIFYFVACALDVIAKNVIAKIHVKELFSYVFFQEFHGFMSLVHFKLMFVSGIRYRSSLIFYM